MTRTTTGARVATYQNLPELCHVGQLLWLGGLSALRCTNREVLDTCHRWRRLLDDLSVEDGFLHRCSGCCERMTRPDSIRSRLSAACGYQRDSTDRCSAGRDLKGQRACSRSSLSCVDGGLGGDDAQRLKNGRRLMNHGDDACHCAGSRYLLT